MSSQNQSSEPHLVPTPAGVARQLAVVALITLTCTGCGTLLSDASYSGTRFPPVVSAGQVGESPEVLSSHEVIGHVNASCSNSSGDVEWTDVLLSDVLCSEVKLVSTMRSKVAEVGGTTLAERKCDEDENTDKRTKTKDGKEEEVSITTTHIRCEGAVTRPKPSAASKKTALAPRLKRPDPVGEEVDDTKPDKGESTVAWRIRVRVTPAKDATSRKPRDPNSVEAVEQPPEGTQPIGDIVARCEQACSKSAVRNGVREAGAKLGATAVVGITCVAEGEGWTCTGRAVAPPAPAAAAE